MDQFVDKDHQGYQKIRIGQGGGNISWRGGLKQPLKDAPAFLRLLFYTYRSFKNRRIHIFFIQKYVWDQSALCLILNASLLT